MASFLFLHGSPFEYPGVLYLSAYLKEKGHNVEVLVKSGEGRNFWDKAREFRPDWVGLSSIAGLHHESYNIAREARDKLGVGAVFGGPYPTYYPQCIQREEVDVVIQGEAEEALVDFLDTCDRGEDWTTLPNVWTKRNGKIISNPVRPLESNLDKYPIPDRSVYYKYPYLRCAFEKQFMSGRGCPYSCYFCFNYEFRRIYNIKGKTALRRHSPERMLEELGRCKAAFPMKQICFNDDIFITDMEWLEKFLPRYSKEIGIPFSCQARVEMVNEDVARILGESCCHHVMIGLESGNRRVRGEIMGKKFSNAQFCKAAEYLHKYGILIKNYNILGCPTETLEEAFETLEVNVKAKIKLPWCALYTPVPGTKTDAIARELGILDKDFSLDELEGSIFKRSLLKQKDIRKIERLQKLFYLGVMNKWLIPFIRKIVHYNLGPLYSLVFFISTFLRFLRESRYDLTMVIRMGIKHLKNY